MNDRVLELSYEIELQPGEKLCLPQELTENIGAGRWLITVRPIGPSSAATPPRNHSAFLGSYAPQDEGLYDDYPRR